MEPASATGSSGFYEGWFLIGSVFLLLAAGLVFFLWTLIWIYRDAEARGKEALLWMGLSLVFWPLPLIVWLFVRPGREARPSEI